MSVRLRTAGRRPPCPAWPVPFRALGPDSPTGLEVCVPSHLGKWGGQPCGAPPGSVGGRGITGGAEAGDPGCAPNATRNQRRTPLRRLARYLLPPRAAEPIRRLKVFVGIDKTASKHHPAGRSVASVAQLVEQLTLNQLVLGSSPSRGTNFSMQFRFLGPFHCLCPAAV
jgi:hypothetical protein